MNDGLLTLPDFDSDSKVAPTPVKDGYGVFTLAETET